MSDDVRPDTFRRVIANIVLTLDGRTTGPAGEFDMSYIAPHGISNQMRDALVEMTHATTVLLGRKNYEGFGAYWPTVARSADAEARDRRFAQWLDDVDKVVFSTRLEQAEWNNSRLADASPAEVVRRLRSVPGGDIRVLSSQSIIRQLLDADEIDRLEITLAPHTAGGGNRLFDDTTGPSTWTLTSATPTDTGAVRLVYDRP